MGWEFALLGTRLGFRGLYCLTLQEITSSSSRLSVSIFLKQAAISHQTLNSKELTEDYV